MSSLTRDACLHAACWSYLHSDREAVVTNIKVQVEALTRNNVFREKIEDGHLLVAGAFYEMSSGIGEP